jgi:hypothetical protein
MAGLRRVVVPTAWRLLASSIYWGLAACGGSPSQPDAAPPPPSPAVLSVTIEVSDTLPRPLAEASVEITSGPDAGKVAVTPASGRVTIDGRSLTGTLALRIAKPGFSSAELSLPSLDAAHLITLVPDVPLDLAGQHELTVEADSTCDLPELARSRTYQALLTPGPNPWYFNIDLGGADFFDGLNLFGAFVTTDAVRYEIYLRGFEEEDPMVEQVSPTEYVSFAGEAIADVIPGESVITARFNGTVDYCLATPTTTSYECSSSVVCSSDSHKLILTRQ